ncbi:MAG: NADP-dependent malic enzyme [Acidobacteria bacterium]|nr:MAG: NADP-dependent malic enzyme [Acidobacteriota bacterium]
MDIKKEDVLNYHAGRRPGKLEVNPSKPCLTQLDLSLAYTPGVAIPCLEIEREPELIYAYTGKGNLVAVISNGTAVLGLGNIGAAAGKPVMEGKGVLFKRFADVDVFDLELATEDTQAFIQAVQLLEPTFGGINLEDIKAPDCFVIEEELKRTMNIPVFHDDQHGTAIISTAAFLNGLEVAGKKVDQVQIVVCGAGAAGIACAEMFVLVGVPRSNILMVDTKGVIYKGRAQGMNPYKERFAVDTSLRTLEDAMGGADVFLGVSQKDLLTPAMLKTMAAHPIVFAMANPDPEIRYEIARQARPDLLMGTGRSDYPNQVNNVLGFPYIFRGALDVGARQINNEMKLTASRALAALAHEEVPDIVSKAYDDQEFHFGPEYLIPKPFDPRVLLWEAAAVAQAAVDSGVARAVDFNFEKYQASLEKHLGRKYEVMGMVISRASRLKPRIIYPEGENDKVARAVDAVLSRKVAQPILIGRRSQVERLLLSHAVDLQRVEIVDPAEHPELIRQYSDELFELRQRKGVTRSLAVEMVREPGTFGLMMLRNNAADGLLWGVEGRYPEKLRRSLELVGRRKDVHRLFGLIIVILKDKLLFCADTSVNFDPTSDELADIAVLSADVAQYFGITPRVALLSFSNFGAVRNAQTLKVQKAVELVRKLRPHLVIDGEMQVGTALNERLALSNFPQSHIHGDANVLIFPELNSGNIGYKLLQNVGSAEVIGPIHLGMDRPVNVVDHTASVSDIVHMTAITATMSEFCCQPIEREKISPVREGAIV